MKKFRIRDLYNEKYGEYIVGSAATGKHGVYLVYGEVSANGERDMTPSGHDEILYLIDGEAVLENGGKRVTIRKEEAVSFEPDETFTFTALQECRYVVAGTHTVPHEH